MKKNSKKVGGKLATTKQEKKLHIFWHFENKTANCLHLARNKMLG
jgi:hypothetical protein